MFAPVKRRENDILLDRFAQIVFQNRDRRKIWSTTAPRKSNFFRLKIDKFDLNNKKLSHHQ
jgi:hypothetical protein